MSQTPKTDHATEGKPADDISGMMPDVASNRAVRKYSVREQVLRVLWAASLPVFRLTPRPLWGVRRNHLRLFGAQVGRGARIYPGAVVFMPWNIRFGEDCTVGWGVRLYALGPMTIGRAATVSQYAHLCGGTHDWRDPARPLIKSPVTIGDGAWICAEAFVGPGVTVGRGAIVGARAVATKDVPDGAVVAGNPAVRVGNVPGVHRDKLAAPIDTQGK